MRACLPAVEIPKRHDLNFALRSAVHPCHIVATVRDPRDIIVSMLAVSGETATAESVERRLAELGRNGMRDLMAIRRRPRTLILRYEEFHADYRRLFSMLQAFLGITVHESVIRDFECRFGIEEVARISGRLGGFDRFDPVSLFHGGHVSEHRGIPGAHEHVLDNPLRMMVERSCHDYMLAFGYTGDVGKAGSQLTHATD